MNDPFFIKPNKRKQNSAFSGGNEAKRQKLDKPAPRKPSQKPQQQRGGPKSNTRSPQAGKKGPQKGGRPGPKKQQEPEDDEEINYGTDDSGSEEQLSAASGEEMMEEEDDGFAGETADERRVRLAKKYLQRLQEMNTNDEEEPNNDDVGDILLNEARKLQTGRLHQFLPMAAKVQGKNFDNCVQFRKCHQLAVTSIVLSEDEKYLYSGSKDCCIIKWDLTTFTKLHTLKGSKKAPTQGHLNQVLALGISSDGLYLASGGVDKLLNIWNTKDFSNVTTLKGHRDHITCLAFRGGSHELFSGSADRTIKVWNVDTESYIETLYGHQSPITAIDTLKKERCITASEDKTTRMWKIDASSQLLFRGTEAASIGCISLLTEDSWVSGNENGEIELWHCDRKKPIGRVLNAHGKKGLNPYWVSAIAALKFSDLIATGSSDGNIKLWKVADRQIIHIKDIPLVGFINTLQFSTTGKYLVAGVGQEPAKGRWERKKEAKNGICIISL